MRQPGNCKFPETTFDSQNVPKSRDFKTKSTSVSTAHSCMQDRSNSSHVLLLGIDGCRWDIVAESGVGENLQRMEGEGTWHSMTMEVPTISAPGWASILTGSTHAEHGLRDNSCVGGRTWNCPDFLAQGYYRDQSTRTFAAAGWPVLVDPAGLAPIIHPRMEQQYAGLHRVVVRDGETYGYIRIDREIADFTLHAIREGSFDLGFCYACDVDDTGHVYGLMGDEYRDAIRRVDGHVGRILDAVTQRAAECDEEWLVVVVTDHGHVDEGGHGGSSVRERESWVVKWSPSGKTPQWSAELEPQDIARLLVDARYVQWHADR